MERITLRETALKGAFIIEPKVFEDVRGFFTTVWSREEFVRHGIDFSILESNASYNKKKGTLRGMHYQAMPFGQAKLVRCTRGAIYDVIIDLRQDSPTFKQWLSVELSQANKLALYVPEEFAHGFQTLEDDSEVFYQVSQVYTPDQARGIRWNDPAFDIRWPPDQRTIIARDESYSDFTL